MSLPHRHHPNLFLSVVAYSLSLYHLRTSFIDSNPCPHNYPGYIRLTCGQNNTKKVRFVLIIVKSKSQQENHNTTTLNSLLSKTGILGKTVFMHGTFQICFLAVLCKYFYLSWQIIDEMQSFYAIMALIQVFLFVKIRGGPQNG